MMVIDNKFNLGQTVYVITDPDQFPFIIIEIKLLPGGTILYLLSDIEMKKWFYDIELSDTADILIKNS